MRLTVTILGCGGSAGVPLIGGKDGQGSWGECDPAEPRNRRTRSSILIEGEGAGRLLVDAGPDLRQQFLSCGVATIDGVLFTHAHADHCLGIDDLRQVNRNRSAAIDCWATMTTLLKLEDRFSYAFLPATPPLFYRPCLEPHRVEYGDRFEAAGLPLTVFRQDHAVMDTLGLRIGAFAYSTDVVMLPEESLALLEGLDTWVVGCFQHRPHNVHANVAQVLDWVARLKPRRTVLTHMGSAMDYQALARSLPPGVEPGYDGMVLDIPG